MSTTSITDASATIKVGGIYDTPIRTVIVHEGSRGKEGTGTEGEKGDPGDSIVLRGDWLFGQTYCPNDGVSWRSSAAQGILSLYVQVEDIDCSPSNVEPQLDPTRWIEIGAADLSNVTGAIWTIVQAAHGFTAIGQPVGFDIATQEYVTSDSGPNTPLAIAVVREVVDVNTAVLQTSGEVPNLDPAIITPSNIWQGGETYYVAAQRGMVTLTPSNDINSVSQPILIPTANHASTPTGDVGVVLPWAPTPVSINNRAVGQLKFYFTATGGQTIFSGVDDQGNTLAYQPGVNTDVFQNGLNLSELTDYTATDGTQVVLTTGATVGDIVEIWTPDSDLVATVTATNKLDAIQAGFDGVTTDFPLTLFGGTPIPMPFLDTSLLAWHDSNSQDPGIDYTIVDNVGNADISFAVAPKAGDIFRGLVFDIS